MEERPTNFKKEEKNYNITKIIAVTVIITALLSFLATTYFYNNIVGIIPFGTLSESYPKLNSVLATLDKYFYKDIDKNQFEEKIIPKVVEQLDDPYTNYMTKEEWDQFNESIMGTYCGIGVTVGPKGNEDYIYVISTMTDSPAQKAGIVTGDKLIKVEGEEFSAKTMDAAVAKIRGVKGTPVKVTIQKSDNSTVDLELIRDDIKIETVASKVVDGIGYIQISMFDVETDKEFEKHFNDLMNQNISGLIIDLRNNGGGVVQTAAKITDMLIPKGVIVSSVDKNGKKTTINSDDKEIEIPLVLLVNEGTASASEILSGAVKDYQKGELVGKKTFGKGLIQMPVELNDGSVLKITVEKYFTPNGNDINTYGIEPTIEVNLPENTVVQVGDENDTQFAKAMEILKR